MEDEALLNLTNIWTIIKKRIHFIVIITLLAVLAAAYISFFTIKPIYQVKTTVFIGNNYSVNDEKSIIDSVNLYQKLMKTYIVIAKSSLVAENTINKLSLSMSPDALQQSISVAQNQDTQVLVISLKSSEPAEALKIINAFSEAFMEEGKRLYPTGDIKIIDSARLPTVPVSPNIKLNILAAFLFALIFSGGIVVAAGVLDRTIGTEEEARKYLNLPVIGLIAKENGKSKEKLVSIHKFKSYESEAYRTLRTNIEFSSIDKKIHTMIITSANPSEGKSTVAANLAVVMSQAGRKTLLIDCDLRKPNTHKLFNISNSKGLSNYLAGGALMQEIINQETYKNLNIITAGIKPPNPAELLSSERMKQFIDIVKGRYDFVILDTPPVCLVTDAQILSQYSDCSVLVVSAGSTDRFIIARAKELLQRVNAKLLGVVLNKLDIKSLYGSANYYSD